MPTVHPSVSHRYRWTVQRPPPAELVEFLAPYREAVIELVVGLRQRVLEVMPNAHEFVWDATNAVALAYAPATRWQDAVCHIASYSKHINLGFNEGASLPDPLGILRGTGSHVRHVAFRQADELDGEWIAPYLHAALAQAGLPTTMGDHGMTIRVSDGPKRRPT
jgi:hypothetical protein